jgi:hypothetical protein
MTPALLGEAEIVRLFRAVDRCRPPDSVQSPFLTTPINGWAALTGQPVEVYEMSTDHYSLLAPPAVASLADPLRSVIERELGVTRFGVTRPGAPAEPPAALSSLPEARQ